MPYIFMNQGSQERIEYVRIPSSPSGRDLERGPRLFNKHDDRVKMACSRPRVAREGMNIEKKKPLFPGASNCPSIGIMRCKGDWYRRKGTVFIYSNTDTALN